MESLLDYALAYAAMGWYVFPCHTAVKKKGYSCTCEVWKRANVNPDFECPRPGKHPRTENGLDDATLDTEQIAAWWKKWPTANIGINCGKSGLLVVDLDTYKDAYEGESLELDEDTVTGLSGGGGAHLFYRLEDNDRFGNSNKNLPTGIDIRGHGGYAIVAPSLHESTNYYQWENDYGPWDKTLAAIPPKLRKILEETVNRERLVVNFDVTKKFEHQATAYGLAAINNQCKAVTTAANGTRNNTLNTAAFALGRLVAGGEVDFDYAYDNLLSAALSIDLTDEEAKRTIDSGINAGLLEPYSSVALDDQQYDGFGECPTESLFGQVDPEENTIVRPVHIDEVQDAIDAMFKAGKPLETIRETHWQTIGNLKLSDRRLLAKFLFDIGLFADVKKAGGFVDQCAADLEKQPVIDRVCAAIDALGHIFRMNLLEDIIEVDGRRLKDSFMSRIFLLMEDKRFNRTQVTDAVNVIAERNAYHPVRDYLLDLEWDGQDHLTIFLSHLMGDGKTVKYPNGDSVPLHAPIMRRWLIGCVARAIDGGKDESFKHQTPMLVMIGAQGRGKSSLVRWLASGVGYQYHREGSVDPHKIDDVRSMVTRWLWEISELGSSLRRSDRDALKGFITQEWHTYRKPYGKYDITKPTLCNFVGTVNSETGFLDDPTGHRRFLPIGLTDIDHSYADKLNVNQLWAQIVAMYLNGESPELTTEESSAMKDAYSEHEIENPLQTYVQMYFKVDPLDENKRCLTADIIQRLRSFNIALHADGKVAGKIINDALAPMGLQRKYLSIGGVKGWGWLGIEPNNKTPFSGF